MRTVAVGTLVLVLFLTVLAANAAVGADRTALNAGFVKTTLEEEGAYGTAQAIAVDRVRGRIEEKGVPLPDSIEVNETVRQVLTRSYLENQTERNVDRAYDYLHGRDDTIALSVNTVPVKDRISAVVERRIRNMTVAEMLDFVSTQENMTISASGISIDLVAVGHMAQNRSAYRSTRQSFRKDVREQVEATLPGQASESTVGTAVNETLASIERAVENRLASVVEEGLAPEFRPIATSAADLMAVGVRGLTGEMSYATFEERLTDARAELATNVSMVVESRLDEAVEDRRVLLEDPKPPLRDRLELARTATGILDLFVYAMPLLAVVLVGLLYVLTRSPSATAFGTGVALTIAGVASVGVAELVPSTVARRLEGIVENGETDVPAEALDVAIGFVDRTAGAFGAQSLALLVLGGLLIAAGLVVRYRDEVGSSAG